MRKFLLLLSAIFLLAPAIAQDRTIKGQVTDANGTPLEGVTVSVSGQKGVVTDADGTYSIKVPSNARQLTFSSVGYISQSFPLAGVTSLNVALTQDQTSMKEVVITAFGI